ncbi:DUF4872 domain-containing protein [Lysinibacillus sp. RC79]|uniref:BtrH N-terminal domain-containing protein n=1 Tax=Lysinibacillus sp. RC79 TaxID=3156296 RepID=UPI003519C9DF
MMIADFPHRISYTSSAGNIRDLMEYEGYKFTEAMLFGLSKGLSFEYVLPEETKKAVDFAMISGDTHNQFEEIASSLRIHYASWVPRDSDTGWEHIKELLKEGKPVFLEVILSVYFKYLDSYVPNVNTSHKGTNNFVSTGDRMFSRLQTLAGTHITILIGIDEQENCAYLIENNLPIIQKVPLDILKSACNPLTEVTKHPRNRYSVYYLPTRFPSIKEVTQNAIYSNMHSFLYTRRKFYGINAIERLAKQMPNWLELMPHEQVSITMGMMLYVSENASDGGFYRSLYAEFLSEAADILGEYRLKEISEDYNNLGLMWRNINKMLANGVGFPEQVLKATDLNVYINEIAVEERKIAERLLSLAETWGIENESFI